MKSSQQRCPHAFDLPAAPASSPAPGADSISARFMDFVREDTFPCVGAKGALARDNIEAHEFGRLGDRTNDAPMLDALGDFAARLDDADASDHAMHSLVALFDGPRDTDELRFEALLWSQLQRLHDLDVRRGTPWAQDVDSDPRNPRFSLSLAGHPFFVIGLHPGASRLARRFAWPALVFNSHRQFERLRADGRYAKMQAATRGRDVALQGSINPNLSDFGIVAEARQYSGRAVDAQWTCPFRARSRR